MNISLTHDTPVDRLGMIEYSIQIRIDLKTLNSDYNKNETLTNKKPKRSLNKQKQDLIQGNDQIESEPKKPELLLYRSEIE